jgi:copper(I)-binding protein
MTTVKTARRWATAIVAAALVLGTAACAQEDTPATPTPTVSITDPWVKAADSGMTAAFGTLVNNTDTEIAVVSAASPASPMELHEVVMEDGVMTMRPKDGGFVIPANGTHTLEPGGDHLMLLDIASPVAAGDEVEFTLTLSDGSTMTFTAVARPFAGGNETYDPGNGMDMGGDMQPSPSASSHN